MRFSLSIVALGLVAIPAPLFAQAVQVPPYRDVQGMNRSAEGVVVLNTDGTAGGIPLRGASISTAGAIATANTFQSALAASASRKGCAIYNTSNAVELVFLGSPGSATAATSIPIAAGGSFNCGSFQGLVVTDQISITSATAAATYVVVSQ